MEDDGDQDQNEVLAGVGSAGGTSCYIAVFCRRFFTWREPERTLAGQLARAGISVGSNVEEAYAGQSRADFLSKISLSLREAREVLYLLRVVEHADLARGPDLRSLIQAADELVAILTTIVKNTRQHTARNADVT